MLADKTSRMSPSGKLATSHRNGDFANETLSAPVELLTVLGGLAEFEHELIRVHTGEGRARAKARGVHMGRPPG